MRSLSGSLLAAQKAASGSPYVRAVVQNTIRGTRHLQFAETSSSGDADDEHDAAADVPYLHRVRVSAGRAQYQRDTGGWTNLSSDTTCNLVAVDAINNARVMVVYNRGNSLYWRESTDQGGSWTAEALILAVGQVVTSLAFVYVTTGGDGCMVYSLGGSLWRVKRAAGAWGGALTWTPMTAATITGCDVVLSGDFHIVVSGTETTTLRPTVWSLILGNGVAVAVDTWTSFFIQFQAEADESITFKRVHLLKPDTWRVTFVEKFSGTPAYTRTMMTWIQAAASWSPGDWEWMDPVPLSNATENGFAIAKGRSTDAVILARPGQVLEAPTAALTLDMSGALVDATIEESDGLHQKAELVFDNSGGAYAGPPAPIVLHRDVLLGLGYDAEYSTVPRQYVVGWEYRRDGGKSLFVLKTRGVDLWLGDYQPRTTIVLTSKKLTQAVRGTAGRAGLEQLNAGQSARAGALNLDWTIHPHESHERTLEALLALYGDILYTQVFALVLTAPLAADSVDYTYATDHAVYRSLTRGEQLAAVSEILGTGLLGQAFDHALVNGEKPLMDRRRDPNATTAAEANDGATARLRKAVMSSDRGALVTPPNVGLEVNDVVGYTDALVSGSQVVARVRGIVTRFRRAGVGRQGGALNAVYEQTVRLGGV